MWISNNQSRRKILFLIVIALLTFIGIVTAVSVNLDPNGVILWAGRLQKQLIFTFIGVLLFYITSNIDYNVYRSELITGVLYLLVVLLLIFTLFAGPLVNGVHRWLEIGGVRVQASEIAKFVVILITSTIFASTRNMGEYRRAFVSIILSLFIALVIFFEPHGSMALFIISLALLLNLFVVKSFTKHALLMMVAMLTFTWILVLKVGGIPIWMAILIFVAGNIVIVLLSDKFLKIGKIVTLTILSSAIIGGILVSTFPFLWEHALHEYQRQRIETFLNPADTSHDEILNLQQSIVAIGSGRLIGKGWGSGTQSKLRFLPEYSTDFIFASYAEQFGLIGAMMVIGLFLSLILILLEYSFLSRKEIFQSVFLMGCAINLLLEVFISIGTNLGIIPITGLPLPFFSFGGTMTIMNFITLGTAYSIIKDIK